MSEFLQYFLTAVAGFVIPFLVGWLLSKFAPNKAAMFLAKWIAKIVKDPKAQNKIENQIGDYLMALGQELKELHPDDDTGSGDVHPSS